MLTVVDDGDSSDMLCRKSGLVQNRCFTALKRVIDWTLVTDGGWSRSRSERCRIHSVGRYCKAETSALLVHLLDSITI